MSLAATIVRAAIGVLFLVSGILTIAGHAAASRVYIHWGIPDAAVTVWLIGALEVVCGTLFGLGVLTRPVGLLLATVMVGAALTAGRIDGGFALVIPVAVFAGCVYFSWQSGRGSSVAPQRLPGVQ